MFIYLSKILPLLVYPLGLACLLLLGLLSADILSRSVTWRTAVYLAIFLILYLGGNHYFAHRLIYSLESRYPAVPDPQAEVIVVLGGATRPAFPPRQMPEVREEGDRLLFAAELYHRGAAPFILVTGGRIPWLSAGDPGDTESADMVRLLTRLGVPEEAIWQETASQNTYENALLTREILEDKGERGIRRIILLTSAYHMPRSVGIFAKQGFEVLPAPADFYVTNSGGPDETAGGDLPAGLFYLLPQSHYLEMTTIALKEYIGLAVYRLRGWL